MKEKKEIKEIKETFNKNIEVKVEDSDIFDKLKRDRGITGKMLFSEMIEHFITEKPEDNPADKARIAELEATVESLLAEKNTIFQENQEITKNYQELVSSNQELQDRCNEFNSFKENLNGKIAISLSKETQEILNSYYVKMVNRELRKKEIPEVTTSELLSNYINGAVLNNKPVRFNIPETVVKSLSKKVESC